MANAWIKLYGSLPFLVSLPSSRGYRSVYASKHRIGFRNAFSLAHSIVNSIRFRRAWKVQGHSLEELPFQALGGVYGSWFGVILIVLVLIAQFYIVRAIFTLLSVSLICSPWGTGYLAGWWNAR